MRANGISAATPARNDYISVARAYAVLPVLHKNAKCVAVAHALSCGLERLLRAKKEN